MFVDIAKVPTFDETEFFFYRFDLCYDSHSDTIYTIAEKTSRFAIGRLNVGHPSKLKIHNKCKIVLPSSSKYWCRSEKSFVCRVPSCGQP